MNLEITESDMENQPTEEEMDLLQTIEHAIGKPFRPGQTVPGFGVTNQHVTGLFLGSLGLSNVPDEIGQLNFLQTLYLDCNKLSHLPDAIGNLQFLTYIDLHSNQLLNLPESIGNLTVLELLVSREIN